MIETLFCHRFVSLDNKSDFKVDLNPTWNEPWAFRMKYCFISKAEWFLKMQKSLKSKLFGELLTPLLYYLIRMQHERWILSGQQKVISITVTAEGLSSAVQLLRVIGFLCLFFCLIQSWTKREVLFIILWIYRKSYFKVRAELKNKVEIQWKEKKKKSKFYFIKLGKYTWGRQKNQ